jgi:hypothetical protein
MNPKPLWAGHGRPLWSLLRTYPAPKGYRSLSLLQRPREEGRRATFSTQMVSEYPLPKAAVMVTNCPSHQSLAQGGAARQQL